ncbi:MAG: DUF2197 domain-containing protein [Tumebacillaceae bacterium]
MAEEYTLRCSLCGTTESVDGTSAEQLSSAKSGTGTHICELCKRKVQFESEQKFT